MSKSKGGTWDLLKPAVVLLCISLVIAALLGVVNSITVDKIAEISAQKTADAMAEVLAADSYEEVPDTDYDNSDGIVSSVHIAKDASGAVVGYVAEVLPSGFGGEIDIMVGVDATGAVTGLSIISSSETSGLGLNASRESFRSQFVGTTGNLSVTKDGGTIDALTGATITSRAVTRGVNAACAAAQSLMKEAG